MDPETSLLGLAHEAKDKAAVDVVFETQHLGSPGSISCESFAADLGGRVLDRLPCVYRDKVERQIRAAICRSLHFLDTAAESTSEDGEDTESSPRKAKKQWPWIQNALAPTHGMASFNERVPGCIGDMITYGIDLPFCCAAATSLHLAFQIQAWPYFAVKAEPSTERQIYQHVNKCPNARDAVPLSPIHPRINGHHSNDGCDVACSHRINTHCTTKCEDFKIQSIQTRRRSRRTSTSVSACIAVRCLAIRTAFAPRDNEVKALRFRDLISSGLGLTKRSQTLSASHSRASARNGATVSKDTMNLNTQARLMSRKTLRDVSRRRRREMLRCMQQHGHTSTRCDPFLYEPPAAAYKFCTGETMDVELGPTATRGICRCRLIQMRFENGRFSFPIPEEELDAENAARELFQSLLDASLLRGSKLNRQMRTTATRNVGKADHVKTPLLIP